MHRIAFIYSGFPLFFWLIFVSVSVSDGEYWNETHNMFGDFQSRREGRKLRPFKNNLLTFDTKDNNIEVAFEFSVPFISIPVKRSIDAVKNTVLGPLANLSTGAVVFAGAMVLAGALAAYLWRLISAFKNQLTNPKDVDGDSENNSSKRNDDVSNNKLIKVLHFLEKSLEKYDIEPTVCSQRLICMLSKRSAENVINGHGSSTDKILDGIFSSKWFLDKVTGTAIDDAIRASKYVYDCDRKYYGCKLKNTSLENMFEIFIKNMKK